MAMVMEMMTFIRAVQTGDGDYLFDYFATHNELKAE